MQCMWLCCEWNVNKFSVIMPKGLINFNLPLAFKKVANWRGVFNIICVEEQRKASHVNNNPLYRRIFADVIVYIFAH